MAALKTKKTTASVAAFLAGVDDARRKDCQTLVKMMTAATDAKPKMWGPSIVGFGTYTYRNASGEHDWFRIGFSPRKQDLTLYLLGEGHSPALLKKLGKHSTGKSCVYIKKLADVDLDVLRQMIDEATAKSR